jgi:two-component system, cell cycle sensor histidine kinase and response regulator CckA
MMGYSEQELLQMSVFDVKSKSQDTSTFAKSKSSKEGLPITVLLERKDGSEFFSEVVGKMIQFGDETQVLGTVRDITDRLHHDEERLLLERQVQHAQKLESLGILAGGIAHDFNNLLMAILGNMDLAQTSISPMSPARENLLEIEKATRRAAELAQQMLAYSGKGRFVIESINLGEIVKEMAHLLEVSITKKVQIQYDLPDLQPSFEGDVTQIRQVILNLITNASEAIGDQVGTISLSTGVKDFNHAFFRNNQSALHSVTEEDFQEGSFAFLEVRDSGCGMDAATTSKLFDPFFTTKFTGRGLGMSAVQGIIRGHRGHIFVESEQEKGTVFKVIFPASNFSNNERPQPVAKPQTHENNPDSSFSGTVLVVDDEEAVRLVAKKMLTLMGFDVLMAEDGRQGLDIFSQHADEISCVLMDLTMPNMDGEEAYYEIRNQRPKVKVILCSGYNEFEATERFKGQGLAGFIQKPFKMVTLQEKLHAILAPME